MTKMESSDVCAIVISRLLDLGFEIDLKVEDYTDVLDALDSVEFVRK